MTYSINQDGFSKSLQELTTSRIAGALQGAGSIVVEFRGKTTTATPTELFIDDVDGQRLQLPLGCSAHIRKTVVAWNTTDDTAATNTPEISTITSSRTKANSASATEAATHVAVDVAAVNTANTQYLTVTANPADGTDTIFWKVILEVFSVQHPEISYPEYGVFDNIQK